MNKLDSNSEGRGAASGELFRLRNVHTQFGSYTKHYFGDLVFTETSVALLQRAKYTNHWGILKDNPITLIFLFGPAALPLAIAGGAIAYFSTGEEEAFNVGGIIGAALSIPLSIWIICRINRRNRKNAEEMLKKTAGNDLAFTAQTAAKQISRDHIKQITYDPGEQTLRLILKYGTITMNISYDEWEKGAELVSSYITK